MFKQVNNYYHKYRKLILIIAIFLVPIVLSSPIPVPLLNPQKFSAELQQGKSTESDNYPIPTSADALGASFLSRLLSIKTESMPGYVCIHNDSEAYFDGQKLDPRDFLDGKAGGTISVPFVYNNVSSIIYVPFASSTCQRFSNEKSLAELQNNIEVRGILPFGRPEIQVEGSTTTVKVWRYSKSEVIFKMSGEYGYEWQWPTYFKNFFLSLFAWVVILASIFQVWDKIFKKNKS